MNYYQIGNLSIPATWLAAVIALLVSALIYRFLAGKKVDDWYWNGFFLYFLVWKFSYLVFHFHLFLITPLSILYFNGGAKGHLVALAILSLYLLFIAGKKYQSFYRESVHMLLIYFSLNQGLIAIFDKNRMESIGFFLLFVLYAFLSKALKSKRNQIIVLFMLVELLLLSIFYQIVSVEGLTIIWGCVMVFALMKKGGWETIFANKKMSWATLLVLAAVIIIVNVWNPLSWKGPKGAVDNVAKSSQVGIQEGMNAPDFRLATLDGGTIKLSDYKGKKVILNFWATWCPPCNAEMPHMENFYKKNKEKGIEILSVNLTSIDKGKTAVKHFAKDYGLTFKIALDQDGKVGKEYQAFTIPTSYMIDSKGVIIKRIVGPMDESMMENLSR